MLPDIPPGRAPKPATFRSEIARRDAKVEELTRRGVVSPPASHWSQYNSDGKPVTVGTPVNASDFILTHGSGDGLTLGTESGGLADAVITLGAGVWDVRAQVNLANGGYATSDSFDFWLTDDAETTSYVTTSCGGGQYLVGGSVSLFLESDGTTTVKLRYFSSFEWIATTRALSFYQIG